MEMAIQSITLPLYVFELIFFLISSYFDNSPIFVVWVPFCMFPLVQLFHVFFSVFFPSRSLGPLVSCTLLCLATDTHHP